MRNTNKPSLQNTLLHRARLCITACGLMLLTACQTTAEQPVAQTPARIPYGQADIHMKDNPMSAQDMQDLQTLFEKMAEHTFNQDLTPEEAHKLYPNGLLLKSERSAQVSSEKSGTKAFQFFTLNWEKDPRKNAPRLLVFSGAYLELGTTNVNILPNVSDIAKMIEKIFGQEAEYRIGRVIIQRDGSFSQNIYFKPKHFKYYGMVGWDFVRRDYQGKKIDMVRDISFMRYTHVPLPDKQSSAADVFKPIDPSITHTGAICPTTGFWRCDLMGGETGLYMRKGDIMPGQTFVHEGVRAATDIVWTLIKMT